MGYGSMDDHSISDDISFTKELYHVTEEGSTNIPILCVTSKVNASWRKKDVKQRCTDDIFKVGDNWGYFLWPNDMNKHSKILTAGIHSREFPEKSNASGKEDLQAKVEQLEMEIRKLKLDKKKDLEERDREMKPM